MSVEVKLRTRFKNSANIFTSPIKKIKVYCVRSDVVRMSTMATGGECRPSTTSIDHSVFGGLTSLCPLLCASFHVTTE